MLPPIFGGSPLLAGPFQSQWDATVPYVASNVVFDRGGWWLAASASTNSRPISGNTDWTLVAGMPYVLVPLTNTQLNNMASTPVTAVPAAGAGTLVIPLRLVLKTTPGTISYDPNVDFFWMLGARPFVIASSDFAPISWVLALVDSASSRVSGLASLAADVTFVSVFATDPSLGNGLAALLQAGIGQALKLTSTADATGSDGIDSSMVTITLAGGGLGYAPGDEFSVDGSGSSAAAGIVDTVGALGVVTAFHLTTSGAGYSTGTGVATTTLTGGGSGLTLDIGAVGDGNGSADMLVYYNIITLP